MFSLLGSLQVLKPHAQSKPFVLEPVDLDDGMIGRAWSVVVIVVVIEAPQGKVLEYSEQSD